MAPGAWWRVIGLGIGLAVACGRTTDPPPDGARREDARADREQTTVLDAPVGPETVPSDSGEPDLGNRMCPMECIREVICCRIDCTGPVVSRGCCSCLPGEVDSINCPAARRCQ